MQFVDRLAVLLAGAALIGCGLAVAQVDPYREAAEKITRELNRGLRRDHLPGAAIAIVDDQRIVWAQTFGYADFRRREKMHDEATFQTGDVAKLLTAIALLQASERGVIDLETPVRDVLPELRLQPETSASPTIRQLLTHHSGLPVNVMADSYRKEMAKEIYRWDEVYLAQQPGLVYSYSNLGYALAGAVVEQVCGKSFATCIAESVTQPLGLEATGFRPTGQFARGHDRRRPVDPLFARDLSALGAFSSIQDLARLSTWLFREDTSPVLRRELVELFFTTQNEQNRFDLDNHTGLVFQHTNLGGHRVDRFARLNINGLHHRGIWLLVPDQKIAVVVLSNGNEATEFVAELARLTLDEALYVRHGIEPPERSGLPDSVAAPDAVEIEALQPAYATALGALRFESADAGPRKFSFLGHSFRADRREDGWYEVSLRLLGFIDLQFGDLKQLLLLPARIDGRSVLVSNFGGKNLLLGQAINATPDDPANPALIGRYELRSADPYAEQIQLDRLEITRDANGWLSVVYDMPVMFGVKAAFPLQVEQPSTFAIAGLGTNAGIRVRFSGDSGKPLMHALGYTWMRVQ